MTRDWKATAKANIERWGRQAPLVILLAMIEELGEICLEAQKAQPHAVRGDPLDDIDRQVVDLVEDQAALGLRTREFLEREFPAPAGENAGGADDTGPVLPDIDRDAVQAEVDDLAPLVYQLTWVLQGVAADHQDGDADD